MLTEEIQPITSLGAEIRISRIVGDLEKVAGAHKTFKEACENERDIFGPVLFLFALLFPVVGMIASIVPPAGQLTLLIVLLIAGAGIIFGVYQFLLGQKQRRIARARENIKVNILAVSENYPEEVEAWGGAKILLDSKLVSIVLKGLHGQRIGANRGLDLPSRGGVILGLGIAGMLFPLLAIIAWAMGNSDLQEMEIGTRDQTGKAQTESGRTLGKIGTLVYGSLIGIIFLVRANASK